MSEYVDSDVAIVAVLGCKPSIVQGLAQYVQSVISVCRVGRSNPVLVTEK